jgi:hypothetical protein
MMAQVVKLLGFFTGVAIHENDQDAKCEIREIARSRATITLSPRKVETAEDQTLHRGAELAS